MHYGIADEALFFDKVGARARDAGFDSLLDYYYFLRYDQAAAAELEALVDALVVNETFFFRELAPLRVVVEQFLVPTVQGGRRPRVWCAACSTGEEPLTLAMLLAEAGILSDVDIVASDISERVLGRARSGRFGKRALRDAPDPALAQRWLSEDKGEIVVARELVDAIRWMKLNLCDQEHLTTVGLCDVVICRNVLIYFNDATTVKVIEGLSGQLKPNGVLFIGVSESLLRYGSLLACEESQRVFYYRKAS